MTSCRESVRALNDALRQHHTGGLIVITPGLKALGSELVGKIVEAIACYQAFSDDNDPHGEHDFGSVVVQSHVVFFKIDYYDLDLTCGSPDPADPSVTRRVMTLMLADEY